MFRQKTVLFILFGIIIIHSDSFPQIEKFPMNCAAGFVHALLWRSDSLPSFVLPAELSVSKRLNISYQGVQNKFLISNDVENELKARINNDSVKYEIRTAYLKDDYHSITLSFSGNYSPKVYYFHGKYLVSPVYYYSRNWKRIESPHFIFVVSNPESFNEYCIDRLEAFVDSMAKLLNYSDELKCRLKKEKIYYYLCNNDDEIRSLTGFQTMGMYYLPYDYIITTYNCHLHELAHLLINYKLQNNSLYTHPFLQEGFAVATGGRGGKEPDIILEMGAYLQTCELMDYTELISREQFLSVDASMSYSLSGLYNRFLIDKTGIDNYLTLYQKHSGNPDDITRMSIDTSSLPDRSEFIKYTNNYLSAPDIKLTDINSSDTLASDGHQDSISDLPGYIHIIADTLLMQPDKEFSGYSSKKFTELFPGRTYRGEKYALTAGNDEISVYNLYTNNLIAKYVLAFSGCRPKPLPKGSINNFLIKKSVFEGDDISQAKKN